MSGSIEPLCANLWFDRIEIIAAGEIGTIDRELRHACHLLQISPEPLRPYLNWRINEDAFERMLESGDYDSAARQLIAKPTCLSFPEHDGPHSIAMIKCEYLNKFVVGEGDTIARAILNAWLNCLLIIKAEMTTGAAEIRAEYPLR